MTTEQWHDNGAAAVPMMGSPVGVKPGRTGTGRPAALCEPYAGRMPVRMDACRRVGQVREFRSVAVSEKDDWQGSCSGEGLLEICTRPRATDQQL